MRISVDAVEITTESCDNDQAVMSTVQKVFKYSSTTRINENERLRMDNINVCMNFKSSYQKTVS